MTLATVPNGANSECGCESPGTCAVPFQTQFRPDLHCKVTGGCDGTEPRIPLNNTHYVVDLRSFATQSARADQLIPWFEYFYYSPGEIWQRRALLIVDFVSEDADYWYYARSTPQTDRDGIFCEVVIRKEHYPYPYPSGIDAGGGPGSSGSAGNYTYQDYAFVDSILIYKEIDGRVYGHKLLGERQIVDGFDAGFRYCPSTDHPYRDVPVIYDIPGYTGYATCILQNYYRRWRLDESDTAEITISGAANCGVYGGSPPNGTWTANLVKEPNLDLFALGLLPDYAATLPDIGDTYLTPIVECTIYNGTPFPGPCDATQTIVFETAATEAHCSQYSSGGSTQSFHVHVAYVWNMIHPSCASPPPGTTRSFGDTQHHRLYTCDDDRTDWDVVANYTIPFITDNNDPLLPCDAPTGTVTVDF